MRIVSLLPAATEILCALGLEAQVVGITHECDFPASIRGKPGVLRANLDPHAPSAAIDARVTRAAAGGEGLYTIDVPLLRDLDPDLVVTQGVCDVCAVPGASVARALGEAGLNPTIVNLDPHSLGDVMGNVLAVGEATGRTGQARALVEEMGSRMEDVRRRTLGLGRPRVYCMEWLAPPYNSGHWVPEMVDWAGGREVLGVPGQPSTRIEPEAIRRADPDVVVLSLCGFGILRAGGELDATLKGDRTVATVLRGRRLVLADGNAHFSRPGPRLVEGVEILGAILHPDECRQPEPSPATYLDYHGH